MHLAKAELLGAGRLIAVDIWLAARAARGFGADMCWTRGDTSRTSASTAVREATGGWARTSWSTARAVGHVRRVARAGASGRHGVEAGAFVDMGAIEVNPNRHICIKGVTILGIGGETLPQYGAALRMLARHQARLPFGRAITHRVDLDQVGESLGLAQRGEAMKVLVAPNGHV